MLWSKSSFLKQTGGWGQQYALITGASQGLGKALAEECARRGLNLALVALPQSGLGQTAQEIAGRYAVRTEFLELDLTLAAGPEALCRWVGERGLDVAVLINNAGVGYNARFEDSSLRDNERCILLNNLALVKITRLLLPQLRRHPRAYILNVASLAAFFPMPSMPVYAPSKAFVLSFTLALRAELRGSSVSASALCPNGIRTNAECCRQIEAAGLAGRLTCLDPDQVAIYALRKMLEGRAVIIPGWLNRLAAGVSRLVPQSAVYAVVAAFWGKTAAVRQQAREVRVEGPGTEIVDKVQAC